VRDPAIAPHPHLARQPVLERERRVVGALEAVACGARDEEGEDEMEAHCETEGDSHREPAEGK